MLLLEVFAGKGQMEMSRHETDDNGNRSIQAERPTSTPPLQFGISTLLWLMVAVGLIFGTLRWMQVSAITSIIVMVILAVCAVVVVFLVYAISKVDDDEDG